MNATPEYEELPLIEGWLTSSVTPKKRKRGKKNKRKEKKRKEPLGFYKRMEGKSDA